ncbi:MAG TPA: S26 family signal peptidase [Dehalococcoidia bacterium]|nr:S26 family signal peptidase [Dehalococcoidia bacterium]
MRGRLVALGAALAAAAWLLRRPPLARYVIDGPSMEPAFRAGDRVLAERVTWLLRPPRAGDIAVLRDPEMPRRVLIKRIAEAAGDPRRPQSFVVRGDNSAASRDSRDFGPVPRSALLARVWGRY